MCIGGNCRCDEGWMGTACDQRACHPRCNEHGTCRDGKCECSPGWNGEHCTIGRADENMKCLFEMFTNEMLQGVRHAFQYIKEFPHGMFRFVLGSQLHTSSMLEYIKMSFHLVVRRSRKKIECMCALKLMHCNIPTAKIKLEAPFMSLFLVLWFIVNTDLKLSLWFLSKFFFVFP